MSEERIQLSRAEADSLMPDGEYVHTFMQATAPGLVLLGADWKRSEILELADLGKVELAGESATRMNHGIAAHSPDGVVFVATKPVHLPAILCPNTE